MQVEIFQLQQEMNLETRRASTYAFMRLPNGKVVRLLVPEDVAALILRSDVETHGALEQEQSGAAAYVALEEPPPPHVTTIEETDHLRVREFGGEDVPEHAPPLTATEQAAMNYVDTVRTELTGPSQAPVEEPKPKLPPGHVEPRSRKHYEALVKEGKIEPNAFAKHVPKNEFGYPIIQEKDGTADPQRVVGQHNQDEDGVGSI